jgi:class 3 adenylate cyclase
MKSGDSTSGEAMQTTSLEQLLQSPRHLKFPPELERDYRTDHASKSLPYVRACLVLALSIYVIFAFLTPWLYPRSGSKMYVIVGIICPLLGCALLFSFFPRYRKLGQSILVIQGVVIALGILAIVAIAYPDEPAYAINYVGLILTVESAFTLGRLRFSNASIITVFILLGYVFVCIAIQGRHHSLETFLPFLNNFLYLTSAAIIGVATGYLLELYLRRDFIQRLIIMNEKKKVEEERQKSEHLLGNILPAKIVGRLKDGATCIADGYADVSVLFLDIANFTPLAARVEPEVLVSALNRIYSKLDELAEEHGVEKIKSSGDAYIVASGVPESRADHARSIADFAVEAGTALAGFCDPEGVSLHFRGGIHTGPVVAGVIGRRKPFYDLWGDTVNIASRMQTNSEVGKIQATEAFRALCDNAFVFVPRGEVTIKGMGQMATYFLAGRRMDVDRALISGSR